MHIIFTPLSIPLLHRFAGKYGRSPRRTRAHSRLFFFSVPLPRSPPRPLACSSARPPVRPPWRCSAMLAGGRWRCQSAAACLQRLPLAAAGAGRGRRLLHVLLSLHGCGPWSALYGACGARLLPLPPPPTTTTTHPPPPPPPPLRLAPTTQGSPSVKLVFLDLFSSDCLAAHCRSHPTYSRILLVGDAWRAT